MKHLTPYLFISFIFIILNGCTTTDPTSKVDHQTQNSARSTLNLDGQWQFFIPQKENKKGRWQTIQVPANWYKQGFDISGKAWYRKSFHLNKKQQNKKITLEFHGADYFSQVWINDHYIGQHEGYFQRFSFSIDPQYLHEGANKILVKVNSPTEKPEDFSLNKRLIKGIFSHHDTRPGGAWSKRGQEKNTGGLWNSVQLHFTQKVFAQQIIARPYQAKDKTWQLKVKLKLSHSLPQGSTIQWQLHPDNHQGEHFSGNANQQYFTINVKQPKLWWPIGHGKPNLYKLSLTIKHQGKSLDQIKTQVAFRTVQLDSKKIWRVNGQRLMLLGTNYIGSQWLSELNRIKLQKDIALIKAANINTIRVHAHLSSPDFYKLCDENGLMIWQDFPLQWGYQDTKIFHQQASLQLKDMLEQYANHPSIIHWTLHNEPPWDANWMKWKYKNYNPEQNKALDKKLYAQAIRIDKSRPTSSHSSTAEHPWLGWYSGHWLDYAKPTKQAFIAEYGAQALPDIASLEKIMGKNLQLPEKSKDWKSWQEWKYHNFQPKESFKIAKIKQGKTVNELIKNTQAYQSQLIQLAAESYRRQSYQPVSSLFQFMFVENWESMNWAIVDYWRKPKPAYEQLKIAYQPILPSLEWNKVDYPLGKPVTIGLWALNDSITSYKKVQYKVELLYKNNTIQTKLLSFDMGRDTHHKINTFTAGVKGVGKYTIKAQLIAKDKTVLGYNNYTFHVRPVP
ncbi:MAG: beta galactosidase jelly roll domain-containing protein [Thiotrichaceae bacterium]|nr:beta galactosidase jelly roll domain-containing protein [Thiotrichaceae bacterium]